MEVKIWVSDYPSETVRHLEHLIMTRQHKPQDEKNHTVGAFLQGLRQRSGLSLREWVVELGGELGKSTVDDVEKGRTAPSKRLVEIYEEKLNFQKGELQAQIDAIRLNTPATVIKALMKNAPLWLATISETLFSGARTTTQGHTGLQGLKLDRLQRMRCLELALKNAAEQTLIKLETFEEREQCCKLLSILSTADENGDAYRHEALLLFFTSSGFADSNVAIEVSERLSKKEEAPALPLALSTSEQQLLRAFSEALVWYLSLDQQMDAEIINNLPAFPRRTPPDVVRILYELYATYEGAEKSVKQFPQEVMQYSQHVEGGFRLLRVAGVVPKDQHGGSEQDALFVSPWLKRTGTSKSEDTQPEHIVPLLQELPYRVVLGRPGAGKSTLVHNITWSHAARYLGLDVNERQAFLPGCPLPLHIELKHFVKLFTMLENGEDRQTYDCDDFLSYAVSDGLNLRAEEPAIQISLRMFQELLERRCMVVQFDGLDEVYPIAKRQQVALAIKHFVLRYPGNFCIVTARPVGYDLAPCSDQLFAQTTLQDFDDEQIELFVRQWYAHAAQAPALASETEEEIEQLLELLQGHGLRHLAENPLLLTVMTSRYYRGRLPEKRTEVYEDCAQLLLFNWATLKGTRNWWQDLKIGQENLYDCMAYLGLALHEQQQGRKSAQSGNNGDIAEVEEPFLLDKITRFIKDESVIVGATEAECVAEADNVLELIKAEAGLIVKSGTGQGDKSLYSFIHRTFQEYFAAMMIYEKYQQEDNSEIISCILREHLHEPHWHEVLLLLLEKLPRQRANVLLEHVLSNDFYASSSDLLQQELFSIVPQNLFFVVDCMLNGISLEKTLAEEVIARLGKLIEGSPFGEQRGEAQNVLIALMQSPSYTALVYRILMESVDRVELSPDARLGIATAIYENVSKNSEEANKSFEFIAEYIQRSDLSVMDALHFARLLYLGTPGMSEMRKQVFSIFLQLAQRPGVLEPPILLDSIIENIARVDEQGEEQAGQILLQLVNRPDFALERRVQLIKDVCGRGFGRPEVWRIGHQMLTSLEKQLNVTDIARIAYTLYNSSISLPNTDPKEEHILIRNKLLNLIQQKDLDRDLKLEIAGNFLNTDDVELRQVAIQLLRQMTQRTKRTKPTQELLARIVNILYKYGTLRAQPEDILTLLLQFAARHDVPPELLVAIAQDLYHMSSVRPDRTLQQTYAIKISTVLAQRPDAPVDQLLRFVSGIHAVNLPVPSTENSALPVLIALLQHINNLTKEQVITATGLLRECSADSTEGWLQFTQTLSYLLQYCELSPDELRRLTTEAIAYRLDRPELLIRVVDYLLELAQNEVYADQQRLCILQVLLKSYRVSYEPKVAATRIVNMLLPHLEATQFFEQHWQVPMKTEASDIHSIVGLILHEQLPDSVRNQLYWQLRQMIALYRTTPLDDESGVRL